MIPKPRLHGFAQSRLPRSAPWSQQQMERFRFVSFRFLKVSTKSAEQEALENLFFFFKFPQILYKYVVICVSLIHFYLIFIIHI